MVEVVAGVFPNRDTPDDWQMEHLAQATLAASQELEGPFPGSDFKGNRPLIKGKRRLLLATSKTPNLPIAKN